MTSTQYVAALVSSGAGILTTGGAAFVVAFFVQLSKGLLNKLPGITPGTQGQNQAVRAYVFLVSLLVIMGDAALNYALTTRIDVANDIGSAITVTLVAIASYHILTSDELPALPLATAQGIAPAPAPRAAPLLPTPKASSDSLAAPVPTTGSASTSNPTEPTPLISPSTGGTANTP